MGEIKQFLSLPWQHQQENRTQLVVELLDSTVQSLSCAPIRTNLVHPRRMFNQNQRIQAGIIRQRSLKNTACYNAVTGSLKKTKQKKHNGWSV
uniref:Uncharacterized protein n=1 Tax=Anguilla anguilla TaxID=7936 RepID=A0A0E9XM10_ANGAN